VNSQYAMAKRSKSPLSIARYQKQILEAGGLICLYKAYPPPIRTGFSGTGKPSPAKKSVRAIAQKAARVFI